MPFYAPGINLIFRLISMSGSQALSTVRKNVRGGSHSSQIYDSFKRIRKTCFRGIAEAFSSS